MCKYMSLHISKYYDDICAMYIWRCPKIGLPPAADDNKSWELPEPQQSWTSRNSGMHYPQYTKDPLGISIYTQISTFKDR